MQENIYKYTIIGGGLTGASAAEGIRTQDRDGSILLIGDEKYLPYNRPPLSKKLWFGKMKTDEIFVNGREFYEQNKVELALGEKAVKIDTAGKTVECMSGKVYRYEKLLLATGGSPRVLPIPGGDLEGVYYYRRLDDYQRMRGVAVEGKSALVIGGGFIGSEMAAALRINKLDVTMLFPSRHLCNRVFPDYLGRAVQASYAGHGVNVLAGETPVSIKKEGAAFVTSTSKGREIKSDIIIVGIGIKPNTGLADTAGLKLGDGIVVDEFLRSSCPDIYAAGDNAFFQYSALGHMVRMEHWDNAANQGKAAGRNMAGANEPYTYMAFFFSDLFEFGYEAVGDVDANLNTFADWEKENEKGIVYYLRDGIVRGVMLCNVWEKVDEAREIIRKGERMTPESLRGAIKFYKKAG